MSFFAIVGQLLSAFGAAVSRRVDVFMKSRPLKRAAKRERGLIRKRYTQLGRQYYELYAESTEENAFSYLLNDLRTSHARISEFESEILHMRQEGVTAHAEKPIPTPLEPVSEAEPPAATLTGTAEAPAEPIPGEEKPAV